MGAEFLTTFASMLEQLVLQCYAGEEASSMLVLLGPPRSGTTLVYQTLVHTMQWAYFCSFAELHSEWPALATLLARRKIAAYDSTFKSRHGFTEGGAGPSESRDLWAQWLGWEKTATPVDPTQRAHMRATVSAVSRIVGAPFLTKNPDHCLHIPKLEDTFPGCLYLRIRRNREYTARSLLHARIDERSDWFGTKPPGWQAALALPPVQQLCFQIDAIEELLDRELGGTVDPGRQMTIAYEDFCKDTPGVVQEISGFLKTNRVTPKPRSPVPVRFESSAGKPLPPDLEEEFAHEFARSQSQPERATAD